MRAMRVREIAGNEDLLWANLLEQRAHNRDVLRSDLIFAHFARLVERQVEKARRAARQTHPLDSAHGLRLTNDPLDVLHLRNVHFAGALALEERVYRLGHRGNLRGFDQSVARRPHEEVDIPAYFVMETGNFPARLI